jgi:hypothetical protein
MYPSPAGTTQAALAAAPLPINQLDHAVHRHTYPEIYNQSKIESVRMMPPRRRQMGHDCKKIQNIPQNNGDGLFERSSQHVLTWTPATCDVMPPKYCYSPFAFRVESRTVLAKGEPRTAKSD